MTTKEIGHLMFVIPACSIVALAVGVSIWCAWEVAKSSDRLEQYYDNPNSIRHRVYFFIWMIIISCMIVGAFLADLT